MFMAMLVGPVTFRLTNARPLLLLAWPLLLHTAQTTLSFVAIVVAVFGTH